MVLDFIIFANLSILYPQTGIVEVLKEGVVTLDDFPNIPKVLRTRLKRIIKEIKNWSESRGILEKSLSKYMTTEEIKVMMKRWEEIFASICKDGFPEWFWWIEAKNKYWNDFKGDNIRIFRGLKYYNIVLDGLEKIYWRHLPRKSEHTKEVVQRLTLLMLEEWVYQHYESHKESLWPWEEQD
jgi:hypothetical protein